MGLKIFCIGFSVPFSIAQITVFPIRPNLTFHPRSGTRKISGNMILLPTTESDDPVPASGILPV